MDHISDTTKLEAITRELNYRRRVYPRWVSEGRMTQNLSDSQIRIFEAIEAEYKERAAKERLL